MRAQSVVLDLDERFTCDVQGVGMSPTAPSRPTVSPQALCLRHGSGLYLLALALTTSPGDARGAVVTVLTEARIRQDPPGESHVHGTRGELARLVFLECATRDSPPHGDPTIRALAGCDDVRASLGTLTPLHRAAIALCVYGELKAWQAGELLGLSTSTVHQLLFWGLEDLAQSPHRHGAGTPRRSRLLRVAD